MRNIDINCDMGEAYGIYETGNDESLFPSITSANIACGFHAGDYNVMAKTIAMALEQNVALGAHPGYPDIVGFGRRKIEMEPREIYHMVLYQIGAFQAMVKALGGSVQHIKPHGALYNLAATCHTTAVAISEAIYDSVPDSIVFGLADSLFIKTAQDLGLKVANERFVDRTYGSDGSLTPRDQPNAIILNPKIAIAQCTAIVCEEKMAVDTVCIHSDHPNAISFARELNSALVQSGVNVEAIGKWKR